jgi:hypothetical protein
VRRQQGVWPKRLIARQHHLDQQDITMRAGRDSQSQLKPLMTVHDAHCRRAGGGEGGSLTLALREPGVFRWGFDGWQCVREQSTTENPLGLHVLAIDTPRLYVGRWIDFTFRFERGGQWIGRDFRIDVISRKELAGRPQD